MTNFNLNVNVKIEAPELCAALTLLAGGRPGIVPEITPPPASQPVVPSPEPVQAPAVAAPVVAAPAAVPVAPPPVVPAPAPIPTAPVSAPTAPARQYSFPDIQRAATGLCDAGKRDGVMALLGQYQIKALSELPPEQYGAFATALRGLGAKI